MTKWLIVVAVLSTNFLFLSPSYAADIIVDSDCSLSDGIRAANTDTTLRGCQAGNGADTIILSQDITLRALVPRVSTQISIEGNGHTISGNGKFRIFSVVDGDLSINGLHIKHGFGDWGGAIQNLNGSLTIKDSILESNAALEGGAIGNDGTLEVANTSFANNSAELGGAIQSTNGSLVITDSLFKENVAENSFGGAISSIGGELTLRRSTFSDNSADSGGGALYNELGIVFMSNSTLSKNSASFGSAIWNKSGTLEIVDSVFLGNSSKPWGGGAINTDYGLVTISKSIFKGNSSFGDGGAISGASSDVSIDDSIFRQNSALGDGGAIFDGGGLRVTNGKFVGNSAGGSGGAIFSGGAGPSTDEGVEASTVVNSYLGQNSAGSDGGAIYRSGRFIVGPASWLPQLNIVDSTLSNNAAKGNGGAISVDDRSAVVLLHATVVNNAAQNGGGTYKAGGGALYVGNSILAANSGGDCFGRLDENFMNLIKDGSCLAEMSGDPLLREQELTEDGSFGYFPLKPESPAVDAADSEYCTETDQIGTTRPHGINCDIGAIEYIPIENEG